MNTVNDLNQRRYLASSTPYDISIMNLKSPILAVCWSFAFPGFGHFYVNNFLFGMVLMVWELAINNLAHINLSIYYSLQGNFEAAKACVNPIWFLSYVLVYVFSMWDSYRRAVEVNEQFLLTYGSEQKISIFSLSAAGINFLSKKNPWLSAAWALVSPGLEHIYTNKLPPAVFAIFWMAIVTYKSHWLAGVLYSFWGNFELAKSVIDPQWLLFLPSVYGFVGYEGYSNSDAINNLFRYEQSIFLRKNFQCEDFVTPIGLKLGE